MGKVKRSFSAEFKSRVAIEAIRGEQTIAEIAGMHQVHPSQVMQWKKLLPSESANIFASKRRKTSETSTLNIGSSISL